MARAGCSVHAGVLSRHNSSTGSMHSAPTSLGNWNMANMLTATLKTRSISESHCLNIDAHVDPNADLDADPQQNLRSASYRQHLHHIWKITDVFADTEAIEIPRFYKVTQ